MTEESPAKIVSLLGVALTSMFFLFAVTVTNANFTQTEKPFPDVFNPDRVVSMLDYTSNDLNRFVNEQLVAPGVQSYAILQDNVNYVIDQAGPSILAYTGLSGLADVSTSPPPRVAGASTQVPSAEYVPPINNGGLSIDSLYRLLIR